MKALGMFLVAFAVILVGLAIVHLIANQQGAGSIGVDQEELNTLAAGSPGLNVSEDIGTEENMPDPEEIVVDENEVTMDLPESI